MTTVDRERRRRYNLAVALRKAGGPVVYAQAGSPEPVRPHIFSELARAREIFTMSTAATITPATRPQHGVVPVVLLAIGGRSLALPTLALLTPLPKD